MDESLLAEFDRLTAWRKANTDKMGTAEYRRATLAHALLNDLVRLNGGTPAQQAYVAQKLKEIENGTHPDRTRRARRRHPEWVEFIGPF